MDSKIVLLSIAVVAVGFFAMPSTVSLFAGQHTFKNASEVAVDNGCRKCHEDVYEETHSPINKLHWHLSGTKGSQDVFSCQECHNVTNVSTYFQSGIVNTSGAHAATTIACLSCHSSLKGLRSGGGYCMSCHGMTLTPGRDQFPMHALAWKYGVGHVSNHPDGKHCGQCHRDAKNPTKYNVFIKLINATITGADEAHSLYYYKSKYPDNQTTIKLKDANAACLGCHSHAGVNITWKRSIGYDLSVNATDDGMLVNFTGVSTATNTTTTSGS